MRVDWCVSSWFRIKNTHSRKPLVCGETSSSPSQRAAPHSPQQPEALPQHCLRRGPAPVDEAPPAEDRA